MREVSKQPRANLSSSELRTRKATMSRVLAVLMLFVVGGIYLPGRSMADQSKRISGTVWIQPAFGRSIGDELVNGRINASVRISDIPLIGSIGAIVPVNADVMLEDPVGILAGGELNMMHFGLEVDVIYLPEAATVRGGLRMCGGLLSASQCFILRQGSLWIQGTDVPDILIVEEQLGNLGITVGANYHLTTGKRWDLWAGPMVVWSIWDTHDFSAVRVDLRNSLEDLLQGNVNEFDLAGASGIAPQNALTFGASAGGRVDFAGKWSLVGQFRYFNGDDIDLPGGSGRYSVAGFSVGLAHRFGG